MSAPAPGWPTILGATTKTLQAVALELFVWCAAEGIRENGVNNRGAWPDFFNASVGLRVPTDPKVAGFPWCTSSCWCIFEEAARQKGYANPMLKTGKAVEVRNRAPAACLVSNPRPGSVIILDHGTQWIDQLGGGERLTDSGHCCIANAAVSGDLSGNTNLAGSRDGNAMAEKLWPDGGDAAAVHGGVIVGVYDFDLAVPAMGLVT